MHGFAISLDSIKFPNNFVLTKSNNLFKSNKTTNFNKKTHFKPTCLCIVQYVGFTDTIRFIRYAPMYWTIHEHLRYTFMIWNFLYTIRYISHNTYRVLYDTDNYGCVSVNQFSSLIGKKSYKFETITTDFGFSSHGKHLPLSQSKNKKISKYWYNGAGECVFVFLPSIATLCIGPLKNFGFNHHANTYYHTPNPKIISSKKIGQNWSLPFPGKINSILPSFSN